MLKFSNTAKRAALAAVTSAGLAGSAGVMLAPVVAHAQYYDRDDRYHRDWDDARYRYYHRDWDDHGWVGVGVPGFGVGFYTNPSPYYYSPYYYGGGYCTAYDYNNGYCSY